MPAPALQSAFGNHGSLLLLSGSVESNAHGLDTFNGRYQGIAAAGSGLIGGQPVPGFEGFTIDTARPEMLGAYRVWEVRGRGIEGGKAERRLDGFPDPHYSLTDWDRVDDAWLTRTPSKITEGMTGSFGGSTVCMACNPKPLGSGWYEVRGSFVGIIRPKPRQRTITVNGQTISSDKLVVSLPGGWTTPQKGVAQLPKIVVRDRYFGMSMAPTQLIPGPAMPPNPPAIKVLTLSGVDVTKYWPGGWHLSSLGDDQISDRSLHAVDWVYEYQWPATP